MLSVYDVQNHLYKGSKLIWVQQSCLVLGFNYNCSMQTYHETYNQLLQKRKKRSICTCLAQKTCMGLLTVFTVYFQLLYRTSRLAQKTIEINGVTIPKGTTIQLPIHLIQHNPEYWPEPEKFDPERSPSIVLFPPFFFLVLSHLSLPSSYRFTPEEKAKRPALCHIPFGWGPRNCIGMRFALMEIKMTLIEILKKYTLVRTPETEVSNHLFLPVLLNISALASWFILEKNNIAETCFSCTWKLTDIYAAILRGSAE